MTSLFLALFVGHSQFTVLLPLSLVRCKDRAMYVRAFVMPTACNERALGHSHLLAETSLHFAESVVVFFWKGWS